MSRVEERGSITSRRFEIRGLLGAGGMGAVYEALDADTQRVVALKTLHSLSADALERFKNEFRALADLHHPNLVQLHELYAEGDEWFFAMELLRDAESFLAHVRPEAPTPPDRVGATRPARAPTLTARTLDDLAEPTDAATPDPVAPATDAREGTSESLQRLRAALAQLAAGLGALHAAGKVHRDLKPSNVLVTPEGRVVILDFGLVSEARGPDDSEAIMGSPLYMAPEQVTGAPADPASDWYAVGVMIYESLAGVVPFTGILPAVLAAKISRDPLPLSVLVPDAPADLASLCDALLRRDPAARPGEAEVLARLGVEAADAHIEAGVFVGRTPELATLHDALAASRTGPVGVLVHGESGIGKSALVRAFIAEVGAGAIVLPARCYEREHVTYKAFDGAMDALAKLLRGKGDDELAALLPADAPLLAQMFPTLRSVPSSSTRAPSPTIRATHATARPAGCARCCARSRRGGR
ncbi:MAG: serine/threonine-protein kinase PknK [Sandaracinaceae bacterium]|nr:serine/threonine-protein kinase PknK [Sandaracinaceae bacterium]